MRNALSKFEKMRINEYKILSNLIRDLDLNKNKIKLDKISGDAEKDLSIVKETIETDNKKLRIDENGIKIHLIIIIRII